MLPRIANAIGIFSTNKEGWLTGLSDILLQNAGKEELELVVLFPTEVTAEKIQGILKGNKGEGNLAYASFRENSALLHEKQKMTKEDLLELLKTYNPDVIHVFGTEFPHALATMEAAKELSMERRVLVGIQGYMVEYAKVYEAGIPQYVANRVTFRDWLKKDSIPQQKEKFEKRAEIEKELLSQVFHITGRTEFDRLTTGYHEGVRYHFMNETLRKPFYDGIWDENKANLRSIFVSQGNYPIKGLHKALQAVGELTEEYPDICLVVAGDQISSCKTLKDRLKISSYGKYLKELIDTYGLEQHVKFTGSLDAEKMKEEYLRAGLFLSCAVIENSPNSMGEAMLMAVPVVASRVGGVPSMIDETQGYLYEYDDIEGLKTSIRSVFENPDEAKKRALAARERAMVTHNQQKNYERLLEIYREICK